MGNALIGQIVRGGIYYAQLVEGGERPVVVVSSDVVTNALRKPVVCELTSAERERSLPTVVRLPAGEAGLERDSYALCHELRTIRSERLHREIGILPAERMAEIEAALRVALDLGGGHRRPRSQGAD